jgi:hypothetical protein
MAASYQQVVRNDQLLAGQRQYVTEQHLGIEPRAFDTRGG